MKGLLLIILGGVMEGIFALPIKYTHEWTWENTWAVGSFFALIVVPWPLALLTIPHLGQVYGEAPLLALVAAIIFGVGWGLGGVFFGLGLNSLGLSIGTSLVMGIIAVGGSVVPMLVRHRDQLSGRGGPQLFIGIAVMIIGLIICGVAGTLKDHTPASGRTEAPGMFTKGLLYCIAGGTLSAFVNLALIFGSPVAQPAVHRGVDPATANNAIWALVFTANYAVNLGYGIVKGFRDGTLDKIWTHRKPRYFVLAGSMGLLWAGGIVVYGRGASFVGPLGAIFGFPVMLIVSILTGNAAGAISGEWRAQPFRARATMLFGVAMMIVAIITLGYGSYFTLKSHS
jgi:L-rhamnose-H+ transport protein